MDSTNYREYNIKCVTFDIDNTLVKTGEILGKVRKKMIRYLKGKLSTKYGKEKFYDIENRFKKILEITGSNYGYHINILLMGYNLDPKNHRELIDSTVGVYHKYRDKYFRPIRGVLGTLKTLKQKGLIVGVITDGRLDKQLDKLNYLGIRDYINFRVVSEEVGFEKPNPKLFEEAIMKAREIYPGLKTEECVHIGDKPEDIEGAKKGMWGVAIRVNSGPYKKLVPKKEPDYTVRKPSQVIRIIEPLISA